MGNGHLWLTVKFRKKPPFIMQQPVFLLQVIKTCKPLFKNG